MSVRPTYGTMVQDSIEAARSVAAQWRERNGEHQGGVVLLWQGKAYGWKDSLRDPHAERPGAVAVDEAGNISLAEGGNDLASAERWVAVHSAH